MKKSLTSEIFSSAIAVILAVLVWFVIVYTQNPNIEITLKNIPVSFAFEDNLSEKGLCVIHSEKPQTISVTLSGTRNDLFKVIDKVKASVNVSNMENTGSSDINIDVAVPIGSVEVTKKSLSSLNVTIDEIMSKNIPIIVQHNGSNKTYLVQSTKFPDTITVSGAKSEIDKISYACVYVDISTLSSDKSEITEYVLMDAGGNELNNLLNVLTENKSISVSNKLYRKKVINFDILLPQNLASKYDIDIKTVSPSENVVGVSENLYNDLQTMTLYLPETTKEGENQKFVIPIPQSKDIYIEDIHDIVIIADIEEKRAIKKTVPIEFCNISADKITPSATNVTLDLFTTDSRLENADIKAFVDLENYTSGEYTDIPLTITASEQITVRGSYKIDFIIN